ncbi:MAG: hypothetical protein QW331_01895, partial [Candidatus Woesearchaeota archaeon]
PPPPPPPPPPPHPPPPPPPHNPQEFFFIFALKNLALPLVGHVFLNAGYMTTYFSSNLQLKALYDIIAFFFAMSFGFWLMLNYVNEYAPNTFHALLTFVIYTLLIFSIVDRFQVDIVSINYNVPLEQRDLVIKTLRKGLDNIYENLWRRSARVFECLTEITTTNENQAECVRRKEIEERPDLYAPKIKGDIDEEIKEFVKVSLIPRKYWVNKFLQDEQVEISASLDVQSPENIEVRVENSCLFKKGEKVFTKEDGVRIVPETKKGQYISEQLTCYVPAKNLASESEVKLREQFVGTIKTVISGIQSKTKITNLFMNKDALLAETQGGRKSIQELYPENIQSHYPNGRVESKASPTLAIGVLQTGQPDQLIIPVEEDDTLALVAGIQNNEEGVVADLESFKIKLPEEFTIVSQELCPNFREENGQLIYKYSPYGDTGGRKAVLKKILQEKKKGESMILGSCHLKVPPKLAEIRKVPEPVNFIAEVRFSYLKETSSTVIIEPVILIEPGAAG